MEDPATLGAPSYTMIHVLFVFLGNICRSPAADAIFNRHVADAGLTGEISASSCGTGNYHIGAPADARMQRHAAARGYVIDHRGRQFREPDDFKRCQYIVAMDEMNRSEILSQAHTELHARKVHRMVDFCTRLEAREIPDPYHGGTQGFETVMDLLEDGCAGLLAHIVRERKLG